MAVRPVGNGTVGNFNGASTLGATAFGRHKTSDALLRTDARRPQFSPTDPPNKVPIPPPPIRVASPTIIARIVERCEKLTFSANISKTRKLTISGVTFHVIYGIHSTPKGSQDTFDTLRALQKEGIPSEKILFLVEGSPFFNGVSTQDTDTRYALKPCQDDVATVSDRCESLVLCLTARQNDISTEFFMPGAYSKRVKESLLQTGISEEDYYFHLVYNNYSVTSPKNMAKHFEIHFDYVLSFLSRQLFIEKHGPMSRKLFNDSAQELNAIKKDPTTIALANRILDRLDQFIDLSNGKYRYYALSKHRIQDNSRVKHWQDAIQRCNAEDAQFILEDLGPLLFRPSILDRYKGNARAFLETFKATQTEFIRLLTFRVDRDKIHSVFTETRETQAKKDILHILGQHPQVEHVVAITGRNHIDVFEALEDPKTPDHSEL